jgi:hypothetical protein
MTRFPSELPRTVEDIDTYSDYVIKAYELPDEPSYRQALAAAIMHLGPVTIYAPKRFFAKSIMKAMANHAAFDKIRALKKEEEAYHKKIVEEERAHSVELEGVPEPEGQMVS